MEHDDIDPATGCIWGILLSVILTDMVVVLFWLLR